jgi:monoterpene epsilon-lactone hydrolase
MSIRMMAFNLIVPPLAHWDSGRGWESVRAREQARRYEARTPLAKGVVIAEPTDMAEGGLRLSSGGAPSGAVLYLHGGGYRQGTPGAARGFSFLCQDEGLDLVSPQYRLAPEHPAPAGLDDALACYLALSAELGAQRVVVAGESAGGGLAFALVQRVIRDGHAPPAGVVAMFPWVDLTLSGASITRNARRDLLTSSSLAESARQYAGSLALDDPLVSPLFGSFEGFPSTVIHVGTRDLLLDDARQTTRALQQANAPVVLREWPGCGHGFQGVPSPEARQCKQEIRQFVRERLAVSQVAS